MNKRLLLHGGIAVKQEPYLAESIPLTGREERIIDGVRITRDCWAYKDVYKYPNGEIAYYKWRQLFIDVIPPCTSEQRLTLDLTPFKDVGYSGTAPNMKANISYTCAEGIHVTVKIGSRAMGTFTSAPSSFTKTNRIEFIFSIKIIRISNRDAYEITITNTDTGKGTRTVSGTMIIYKPQHQEIDIWKEYDYDPTLSA